MPDPTKLPYAIAAKAFVINEKDELLIIKRRPDDVHFAGTWEIPGGRLETGEDPKDGAVRETKEETGLDIEVHEPLGVRSFVREDGQHITMIIFRCEPRSQEVQLSEEHTEYAWKPLHEAREVVHEAFGLQFDTFERYYKGR